MIVNALLPLIEKPVDGLTRISNDLEVLRASILANSNGLRCGMHQCLVEAAGLNFLSQMHNGEGIVVGMTFVPAKPTQQTRIGAGQAY